MNTYLLIVVLVVSIFVSFWTSLVEATYLALHVPSLAPLLREGNKRAEIVLTIISNKPTLLSVTNLVDTLANMSIATSAGLLLSNFLGSVGWIYNTLLISVVIMVFLYLVPKTIGVENSLNLALRLSRSSYTVIKLLSPFAVPLANAAKRISDALSGPKKGNQNTLIAEFEDILLVLEKGGHIEPDLAKILRVAFSSSRTTASEICTPISEVVSIPTNLSVREAIKVMSRSRHPRLPVYDTQTKSWQGAVTLRSLIDAIANDKLDSEVSEFLTKPVSVSHDESVASVVQKMEEMETTIAFVFSRDELVGILTLTDVLESLIGIKL